MRIIRPIIFGLLVKGLPTGISASAREPSSPASLTSAAPTQEERLRKMEELNRTMAEQFSKLATSNQALSEQLKKVVEENQALARKVDQLLGLPGATERNVADNDPNGAITGTTRAAPASDRDLPGATERNVADNDRPAPNDPTRPAKVSKILGLTTTFGDGRGVQWASDDEEFLLQFHHESQLDSRFYQQSGSNPVAQSSFYVNRMRFIFNGRFSKPISYRVAIDNQLGTIGLLDAYFNFNYDERLQFRIGRFRAPYTYDWYALSNQFLTTPERSIFAINYGYSRNIGPMLHGELFEKSVDYALGVFNGQRNSYFDYNSGKDVLAFLNFRPFLTSERSTALKFLNVGASLAVGQENNPALPSNFTTSFNATGEPGAAQTVPSFLQLNPNVIERGARALYEIHLAYYYKGLTVQSAWDSGFNDYALTNAPGRTRLPVSAYHAQVGYFLTGERIESRTFVTPLRPFDLRRGRFGLGAVELQTRFDSFRLGRQVFNGGLADANNWSDSVQAVDLGFNWYLNTYVKLYFDWQHSMFGSPVVYAPGKSQITSDLFWMRFQVNF